MRIIVLRIKDYQLQIKLKKCHITFQNAQTKQRSLIVSRQQVFTFKLWPLIHEVNYQPTQQLKFNKKILIDNIQENRSIKPQKSRLQQKGQAVLVLIQIEDQKQTQIDEIQVASSQGFEQSYKKQFN
ncbi:unnamed protein product [Paramecium octaurelia]|uniref:Uncharacterized protein n=1 Tax=Paramecium octaurelia TaxID=43137 RepID=A0A8S1SEI9_PAROT|nr:unnamed protein product [Paramecium octaurelia]